MKPRLYETPQTLDWKILETSTIYILFCWSCNWTVDQFQKEQNERELHNVMCVVMRVASCQSHIQ